MKMGRRLRCSSLTSRPILIRAKPDRQERKMGRDARLLPPVRLGPPCRRPILIATKCMLFRGQDTISSEFTPDGDGNTSNPSHEILKISWEQRLLTIALGLLWSIVYFNHDGVRPCRDGCKGHGRHELANTDPVRRVDDYGQMGFRFEYRNGIQIQGVARHVLERAYATLAKQHVEVPFVQDVFSAHKEVLDRCCHPSFEHYRQLRSSYFPEQGEILHVTSSNLQTICICTDQLKVFRVHHFGNDWHPGFLASFCEEL